jgi:hypothetical protein
LLPGVTARLSASTGLLVSTESTTDLSSGGTDIAIHDTTVTAGRANPIEVVLKVLCENCGSETLRHLIIVLNGFFDGLELHDICNRCKYFVLHNFSIVLDLHDRGLHVIAIPRENISTIEDFSTLLLNGGDTVLVHLDSGLSVKGAEKHAILERVSTLDCFVSRNHFLNKLVKNALMQKDTSHSGATLSGSTDACENASL